MIKKTSYEYGEADQQQNLKYYRLSKTAAPGTWHRVRVEMVAELIDEAHRMQSRPKEETVVVDIGCSIGTFALESARRGFRSTGVDFDESAIRIARALNSEENAGADFHVMDVSDWPADFARINIAVCADIFEHLHDDELGALFVSLRKNLSSDGLLVFHTAPQEYDYLFWRKKGDIGMVHIPWYLFPFKWMSDEHFTRVTRIAALAIDAVLIAVRGKSYKEHIKRADHPNPLTKGRLTDLLERAGYEVLFMRSRTVDEQMKPRHAEFLRSHSVTHRSLYGIARIPSARPTE